MKITYKCLTLLIPAILSANLLFSQFFEGRINGKDRSVYVKVDNNGSVYKFDIPDNPDEAFFKAEDKDLSIYIDVRRLMDGRYENENVLPSPYDPGVPVEVDFPVAGDWSPDGNCFAFVNQHSDNLVVYDAANLDVLATIPTGREPLYLRMTSDKAYVCCHKDQEVWVISLDDYTLENIISVDGTPCQVEITADGKTAYIACDKDFDGKVIAWDLDSNKLIYEISEPSIYHWLMAGPSGRKMYGFTKFHLDPDGEKFVSGYAGIGWPVIFDAKTGSIEKVFKGIYLMGCNYSPTGDTLYMFSTPEENMMILYRINMSDYSVIDSILTNTAIYSIPLFSDIVISRNGERAITAGDGCCIFDFASHTVQRPNVPVSELLNILQSRDCEYAIIPAERFIRFIHLASGQVYTSQYSGVLTGNPAITSPVEDKIVAGNLPHYTIMGQGNEMLYCLDFNDVTNITCCGSVICGAAPEADVPSSTVMTPDGSKIITANMLSFNITVFDAEKKEVDTIIPLSKVSGILPLPNNQQMIAYGANASVIHLISLESYDTVAVLGTGNIDEALLSSDGRTAYLIEYSGGFANILKVGFEEDTMDILDQASIPATRGVFYQFFGEVSIYTKIALSPDDKYLLICYNHPSLGSVLNIVDAQTLGMLTQVPIPYYGIFDIVFSGDNKRVILLGFESETPIIFLDGINSFVENEFSIENYSFSGEFNSYDGMFYVLNSGNYLYKVDPLTGEIVDVINHGEPLTWKVRLDKDGKPLILSSFNMLYEGAAYPMPGITADLLYNESADIFVSSVPGPDWICVFDPLEVGLRQYPLSETHNDIVVYPNPASGFLNIRSLHQIKNIRIIDMMGSEVWNGNADGYEIAMNIGSLAAGVYRISVLTEQGYSNVEIIIK